MKNLVIPFSLVLLISLLCILLGRGSSAQTHTEDAGLTASAATIEHVLRDQQVAWNRHDLDGFMTGYWNSSQLTFFSGATQHDGWQATLDRYRAAYASPGHEMGKLTFAGLSIEMLSADAAFVRGEWKLSMPDGKVPRGLFTLVFRRFNDGWKIVHDHTSATE